MRSYVSHVHVSSETIRKYVVQLRSCYLPCEFMVNKGQTYQVAVAD